MRIVISSGHGRYTSGAIGIINEVTEARRVTDRVAELLRSVSVGVVVFHDNTSRNVATNLNTIVNFHNAQTRDLDVSVHFNAFSRTDLPRGTEVLYLHNRDLAARVSRAISDASGLINRGARRRTDLFFLNNARRAPILIEVCFVDSSADVRIYQSRFEEICRAIAESLSGRRIPINDGGGLLTREFQELDQRLRRLENRVVFNHIRDVPDWGAPTIQKLINRGFLRGTDEGLNISEDLLRVLVINDRAGIYG